MPAMAIVFSLALGIVSPQGSPRAAQAERSGVGQAAQPPRGAASAINILLPAPISDAESQRYRFMLCLNPMQVELYQTLLTRHRQTAMAEYEQLTGELWAESASIAMQGGFATDPLVTERFALLMQRRNDAAETLGRLDNALFDALVPSLHEDQMPLLESVKRHRHRRRLDIVRQEFPGAATDLTISIMEISRDRDIVAGDQAAFHSLLADYETALTTAQAHYAAERLKVMVDEARAAASMPGASPAAMVEIDARIRAMQSNLTRRAKRVAEVNRQYLDILTPLMDPEAAELIRSEFQRASYPPVFPNPFDIGLLARALRQDEKLTAEQRDALGPMLQSALQDQADVSEKMIDEYSRWRGEWLLTRARPGESFDRHKATMTQLQDRRRKIALDLLAFVESDIPEQGGEVRATCSSLSKSINEHRPRESGSRFFP